MPASKQGLDWFPFDVDLLDDESLDFLREQYGVVVNDIYIALLTLLYRKKGYYVPYETKKEKEDCVWYVYKRVRGGKYPVQQEAIPTVIEAIVARGLFDGDHFNKIITSERAQRTYYSATVDRKLESFDIRPEYWLLDDETMRKLSKKHPYYLFLHQNDISSETQSISGEMQVKSDETSLDKIRVNNISNDILKVSKKDIYKKQSSSSRESYDEIMDRWEVVGVLRAALGAFLQHCTANGQVVTNDRFEDIIDRLYDYYGAGDEKGMSDSLYRAIQGGYYDIKELKR